MRYFQSFQRFQDKTALSDDVTRCNGSVVGCVCRKRGSIPVKVPRCHRCLLHKRAERRPQSLVARLWRWQATSCSCLSTW